MWDTKAVSSKYLYFLEQVRNSEGRKREFLEKMKKSILDHLRHNMNTFGKSPYDNDVGIYFLQQSSKS